MKIMTTVKTEKEPENHLHESKARWFAVRTKFKSEKAALKHLEHNKINAYLPIRNVTRLYGHKKRTTDLPLINNFVFVKIVAAEYVRVLATENVAGFLRLGKNLLSIPEKEIDLIRRLIGEDYEVEVTENTLQIGDWVEVVAGSLLGLRGRLITEGGKEKFVVALTNSGYSLEITIDKNLLQKVEKD